METFDPQTLIGLGSALGIGLLIGVERERRKGKDAGKGAAGLRTFAITSLLGALSLLTGSELVLAGAGVVVGTLAAASYMRSRSDDPGLTTEVALMVAFLLGALAMRQPALAGGLSVLVTMVLASRTQMHRFVSDILSAQELHDALLLGAAALVVLPLMPDRTVGPLHVFNPRTIWTLVVLVMVVNSAGYVALRVIGPRFGLAFAGFLSGFVSSAATVGAMGHRAAGNMALLPGAVSGAVLSSVATVIELALIVGATDVRVLVLLTPALVAAGVCAVAYSGFFTWRSLRQPQPEHLPQGRPFDPKVALAFAASIATIMFVSAAISQGFGAQGRLLAAAVAGFADSHAVAGTYGSMAASGAIDAAEAELAILVGFSTNALTKCVVAWVSGGRTYALRLIPGQILMVAAAWAAVIVI